MIEKETVGSNYIFELNFCSSVALNQETCRTISYCNACWTIALQDGHGNPNLQKGESHDSVKNKSETLDGSLLII